jgi:1-acyl-sn-glycerol-3-phosphate acyltransferase
VTNAEPEPAGPLVDAVRFVQRAGIAWVRRYHRLTVTVTQPPPDEPTMFVANHGFGGLVDLDVYATFAALEEIGDPRPVTSLTHEMAWTLKVGRLVETIGAVPASRRAATDALARGNHVLVFPGGDREAAKPWSERNQVQFHGRRGFAAVALAAGVPIVPIVTSGAGDTLLVLSNGEGLVRSLRLDRFTRLKVVPISLSVPWGISIGVVGLLPYLPLPAKLDTVVLPAIRPGQDEDSRALANRVQREMQASLTELTQRR